MSQREELLSRLTAVFGGSVKTDRYYTDDEKYSVELVSRQNSPCPGLISYSTLGAFQATNFFTAQGKPLRVEFAGVCWREYSWFPGLLSTCAFALLKGQVDAAPYRVYPDILPLYCSGIEMKHLLLIPPFGWEKSLGTVEFEDCIVTWLMVNPISDGEFSYLQKHGPQALIDHFVQANIDMYDLNRKSVF